ncbi:MAG TPA: hypothetical protein PLS49_01420 [Candidatus Woesebacteria bacterium]|nr:hypothetical protein [Candidatus Woesebacteria bacterium]
MLTPQDLTQIEDLVEKLLIKFEEKISQKLDQKIDSKIDSLESKLTRKIDERADQTIEYINSNIEAHEKWLKNHESRIYNLEGNGYQVNDRKKIK